jgi:hypothetical protein
VMARAQDMLNDRKASELISQSLARDLTEVETEEINQHLTKDANSVRQ